MVFARQILAHTPVWVFVLLAYLVWQGIGALRPRVVTIRRMLVVPALFLLSGVATLFARHLGADAWIVWGVALAGLVPVGRFTGPGFLAVDPEAGLLRRAGSVVPLCRNVGVFVLQYVFAVVAAIHPDTHSFAALAARAVSGATSGYVLGWLLAMRRHWRTAPRLPLRTA